MKSPRVRVRACRRSGCASEPNTTGTHHLCAVARPSCAHTAFATALALRAPGLAQHRLPSCAAQPGMRKGTRARCCATLYRPAALTRAAKEERGEASRTAGTVPGLTERARAYVSRAHGLASRGVATAEGWRLRAAAPPLGHTRAKCTGLRDVLAPAGPAYQQKRRVVRSAVPRRYAPSTLTLVAAGCTMR